MTTLISRGAAILAVTAVGLTGASAAYAQGEQLYGPLTQKKTYIKTASDTKTITIFGAEAFAPTAFSCPGSGNCVVEIDFSVSLFNTEPYTVNEAYMLLDGANLTMTPYISAWLNSVPTFAETRSFKWALEVSPGTHTFSLAVLNGIADPNASAAKIGPRAMTLNIYK